MFAALFPIIAGVIQIANKVWPRKPDGTKAGPVKFNWVFDTAQVAIQHLISTGELKESEKPSDSDVKAFIEKTLAQLKATGEENGPAARQGSIDRAALLAELLAEQLLLLKVGR